MPELSLKPGSSLGTVDSSAELRDRLGLPRPSPRPDRPGWATKLIQGVKTFLWVAPLTVLLWIYAEQEQTTTRRDVPARIEVRGSSPDRIATLLSSQYISVDLKGPTAGVEKVQSALLDLRSGPLEITITEQPPFEGELMSLAERLSNSDLFKRNAVTVERASPMRVRVEARIRRPDVPLIIRDDQKQIVASVLDPTTVSVEGPESIISDKRLVAVADVSSLANTDIGNAPVDLPIGLFIKDGGTLTPRSDPNILLQRTVRAKVEAPKVTTVRKTITKSIRIVIQAPATVLFPENPDDAFRVKMDKPTVSNLTVMGPPEAIEQLTGAASKFDAAVILRLDLENFRNNVLGSPQDIQLDPEKDFVLPLGVKVIDPPRISFTITKGTN